MATLTDAALGNLDRWWTWLKTIYLLVIQSAQYLMAVMRKYERPNPGARIPTDPLARNFHSLLNDDTDATSHHGDANPRYRRTRHFQCLPPLPNEIWRLDQYSVEAMAPMVALVLACENGRACGVTGLLDSGAACNWVRQGIAKETGYPILPLEEAEREAYRDANGEEVVPLGKIRLRFCGQAGEPSHLREELFMILPDRSGIDLILGWTFLLSAGVMQFNRRVLPIYKDPKSEKEQRERDEKQRRHKAEARKQEEEVRKRKAENFRRHGGGGERQGR